MNKEFHDKVISLIPSETLKKVIKETDFQFPELDIFILIDCCAPSFDERIALLNEAKKEFSPELAKYTEDYIEYQKGCLALFMEPVPDYVYSVEVVPHESYLFKTAAEAIEFTAYYLKTGDTERFESFFIEKTPILELSKVNKDVMIAGNHNCTAYNGKVIEVSTAYDCDYKFIKCDGNCLDCELLCHIKYMDETRFPKFLEKGDLIKYPNSRGKSEYAIISLGDDCDCGATANCVPLDAPEVIYHAFEDSFYAHRHPELTKVEKADVSELDEEMRKDYLAFREYLNSNKSL